MACSKWEETGLLYSSQELDQKEAAEFADHLRVCDECRGELELYQKEQASFFTQETLAEVPSKAVDAEILRVCGSARKQVTSVSLFPLVFRRTIYSVSFFLVGFVVVGYFAVHMERANRRVPATALENNVIDSALPVNAVSAQAVAGVQLNDSIVVDSLNDTNARYTRTRGNLGVNGVYPVDLQQKK